MDQKTHEYRLSQWEPIITECKNSGLPVATWCRENNVDKQKFYYWQRRLRAAVFGETTTDAPNFKPPAVPNKKKTTIVELPTPIIEPISTQASIVLHIKGCTIEVNNNVTPELIATIMQVMSHA